MAGVSDALTEHENASIRRFVELAASEGYLSGRVLDYGAGRMPYREIVQQAGGAYTPYDDPRYPDSMATRYLGDWGQGELFDAILCTQVLQYVPEPWSLLTRFHELLKPSGWLVLTYPTNWPEVQESDLWRFPRAGMERLLAEAGFNVVLHQRRESLHELGYEWAFGYGVVARA